MSIWDPLSNWYVQQYIECSTKIQGHILIWIYDLIEYVADRIFQTLQGIVESCLIMSPILDITDYKFTHIKQFSWLLETCKRCQKQSTPCGQITNLLFSLHPLELCVIRLLRKHRNASKIQTRILYWIYNKLETLSKKSIRNWLRCSTNFFIFAFRTTFTYIPPYTKWFLLWVASR